MNKRFYPFLISVCSIISYSGNAQSGDNFNSRTDVPVHQLKGFLQGRCWIFFGFDVNKGWIPTIEGDGAMVSGEAALSIENAGIYTPVLQVPGSISISFRYQFNQKEADSEERILRIFLAAPDNSLIALLETTKLSGPDPSAVCTFNRTYSQLPAGQFKIFLNIRISGGNSQVAIDELNLDAHLGYTSGCNEAPVAVNDLINGKADRTASGTVISNDHDPDKELYHAYLMSPSSDGDVVLSSDGAFTFTPAGDFTGNSTSFTYKICDDGAASLCSDDATVTISFDEPEIIPLILLDFFGRYKNEGFVSLSWITRIEKNTDKFLVERSCDGLKWVKAGSLKACGQSAVNYSYTFLDKVNKKTVANNDLYYRLKLVDGNGHSFMSRILIVRVYNTKALKMVSVTPNPVKNDIAVMFQLNEPSYVVMKIRNAAGNEVMRRWIKSKEGLTSILMDNSSKLNPGLYVLEVIVNSKERMIVKLLKE